MDPYATLIAAASWSSVATTVTVGVALAAVFVIFRGARCCSASSSANSKVPRGPDHPPGNFRVGVGRSCRYGVDYANCLQLWRWCSCCFFERGRCVLWVLGCAADGF